MHFFYRLDSTERFVYHYTKATTLVEHILTSMQIRFSRLTATNDPREYKTWIFDFGTNQEFGQDFHHTALATEASTLAKSNCRVFCSTMDEQSSLGGGIDKIYGRGFCRPRMWAQYAQDHSGACLILDRAKLHSSIVHGLLNGIPLYYGSVLYKNRSQARSRYDNAFTLNYDHVRVAGLKTAVDAHVSLYYRDLFFEKALDWSDEREYRWVTNLSNSDDLFVSIHDALVGVLIGDNFPDNLRDDLGARAFNTRITVGQLNWKLGVPEVIPFLYKKAAAQGWPIASF